MKASRRALRTRSGCLTCRKRRKKCDEQRPACTACVRNNLECQWPLIISFDASGQAATSAARRGSRPQQVSSTTSGRAVEENVPSKEATPSRAGDGIVKEHQDATLTTVAATGFTPLSSLLPKISLPPSSLLEAKYSDPGLLEYYVEKTAIALGNGTTGENPFIRVVLPLAITDRTLLQLLLAQTAAHRAEIACSATSPDIDKFDRSAADHYSLAIQSFRGAISEYVAGNKHRLVVLALGSLTLCITEMAKGDVDGLFFSHLAAATSLFSDLVASNLAVIDKHVRDFLIEYYVYTISLSRLSIDCSDQASMVLEPWVRQAADDLIAKDYIGDLCGSWLPLLVLIQDIVTLHSQVHGLDEQQPHLTPDQITSFATLRHQVTSYTPSSRVAPDVALAGRLYQQASLIYLLTILGPPLESSNGPHIKAIDAAIVLGLDYLDQIPLTARISTNFIWPLVVIGSCLTDAAKQERVRTRLTGMTACLGFGSLRATVDLLEHTWKSDGGVELGPWAVRRTMRRLKIWIAFA